MLTADAATPCPQGSQSLADLERDLLELLDYSHFALVKELIQNRLTVVWCTRLARAQDEAEERRIEVRLLVIDVERQRRATAVFNIASLVGLMPARTLLMHLSQSCQMMRQLLYV